MTLLESALNYARKGWPVLPCHPQTKRPLVGAGGVKNATTDTDIVRPWWRKWPKAMIGLATGQASGLFVIDVDAGADPATGETY